MTGEGVAAIILAGGTVAGQLATIVMQFAQRKVSAANSDKLDTANRKIDEVHASTTAIADNTGTHKALDGG